MILTPDQIKQSIIDCADHRGEIRFGSSPPAEALDLVREGRLVRLSYRVFALPEGG